MKVTDLKARFGTYEAAAKYLGIRAQNFAYWNRKHGGEVPAKYADKLNATAPATDMQPAPSQEGAGPVGVAPDQV